MELETLTKTMNKTYDDLCETMTLFYSIAQSTVDKTMQIISNDMFYKLFVESFKEASNNGDNDEIVKLLCNATGKNVIDVSIHSIHVNGKNEFWSVDFCVDGKQYSISVPIAPRDVEIFDFQYVKEYTESIAVKLYTVSDGEFLLKYDKIAKFPNNEFDTIRETIQNYFKKN